MSSMTSLINSQAMYKNTIEINPSNNKIPLWPSINTNNGSNTDTNIVSAMNIIAKNAEANRSSNAVPFSFIDFLLSPKQLLQ